MNMKRVVFRIAMVGVLAAVVASGPQLNAATDERNEQGLRGSWDIRITQPDFQRMIPIWFHLHLRDGHVRRCG